MFFPLKLFNPIVNLIYPHTPLFFIFQLQIKANFFILLFYQMIKSITIFLLLLLYLQVVLLKMYKYLSNYSYIYILYIWIKISINLKKKLPAIKKKNYYVLFIRYSSFLDLYLITVAYLFFKF